MSSDNSRDVSLKAFFCLLMVVGGCVRLLDGHRRTTIQLIGLVTFIIVAMLLGVTYIAARARFHHDFGWRVLKILNVVAQGAFGLATIGVIVARMNRMWFAGCWVWPTSHILFVACLAAIIGIGIMLARISISLQPVGISDTELGAGTGQRPCKHPKE